MGKRPLVIHNNRMIYFIEKLDNDYKIEDELNRYATLIQVPSNVHTYQLDDYSLWSAAMLDIKVDQIINFFSTHCKHAVPSQIIKYIQDTIREFWTMEMYIENDNFKLKGNKDALQKVLQIEEFEKFKPIIQDENVMFKKPYFYDVRDILLNMNVYLIEQCDEFGYCQLKLNPDVKLHSYQKEAVNEFVNARNSGRGVIIMPPGSGKTLVGIKIIEQLGVSTLVLVNKDTDMWLKEIKEKTNFDKNHISINKIQAGKPISIVTYDYAKEHLCSQGSNHKWGLIIYDDANNLPAEKRSKAVFLQSKYKLAMDSILARSDNNEVIIFKTIGPKVYHVTMKRLENGYYQHKVKCTEVLIPYEKWDDFEEKSDIHTVSKNINKIETYRLISNHHQDANKVVISFYRNVSKKFNELFQIELCDGKTSVKTRNNTVQRFNDKKINSILLTQISEKLRLLDIDVLLSLSYLGRSEREEYLRIGKLKSSNYQWSDKELFYYALVSKDTKEEKKYQERRQAMIKHGYEFKIRTFEELRREYGEA